MKSTQKLREFAAVCGIVGTSLGGPMLWKNTLTQHCETYLEEHLEDIQEEQETALAGKGITFSGVPILRCALPESQRKKPFPKALDTLLTEYAGFYDSEENTLYIVPSLGLAIPGHPLTNTLGQTIAKWLSRDHNDIDQVVQHELGHFYAHQLVPESPNSLHQNELEQIQEDLRYRLISEGVAEYFRRAIREEREETTFTQWPAHLGEFSTVTLYIGGYTLVKPILDTFGKEGIEYLFQNLPSETELTALPQYQARIVRELKEREKP